MFVGFPCQIFCLDATNNDVSATHPLEVQESGRSFDDNVSLIVETLMAIRRIDAKELAPLVGMTKSTLYNRLSTRSDRTAGRWLASELGAIGRYFDVSPRVFYEPAEDLLEGSRTGSSSTALTGIDGGGDELALRRRDPNQLELDLRPHLTLVRS